VPVRLDRASRGRDVRRYEVQQVLPFLSGEVALGVNLAPLRMTADPAPGTACAAERFPDRLMALAARAVFPAG
jgi:hypothetical protein